MTDHEDVAPPEVQERVTAFRQQRDEWREVGRLGEPFYVLYDAIEFPPGTCMSCGNDKRPRRPGSAMHLRCRPCLTAVEIMMAQP